MASRRFIFLEIAHREVGALLWHIQRIMTGVEPRHPVHLTVRGPYRQPIAGAVLKKYRGILSQDTLRIGAVGRFANPDQEVVFLRVDSPNLRRIWWKPSYPIKHYGYRPHISLYRGNDASFANLMQAFLERERLEFTCKEHRLTVHLSDGLPFGTVGPATPEPETPLIESGSLAPSLLSRLQRVVDEYRSASRHAEPAHSSAPWSPTYTPHITGFRTR